MSRRNLLALPRRPTSACAGQRCFNKDINPTEKFVYTFKPVIKSYHSSSDITAALRCNSQNEATGSYKPEALFLRRRSSPAVSKANVSANVDSDSDTSSEGELRSLATLFDAEAHCVKSQQEQQEQQEQYGEGQEQQGQGQVHGQGHGQGGIDPDMYEAMCEVFDEYDVDGNGHLERHELKMALHTMGDDLTDDGLDEFLALHDINGDGQFSKEEFVDCVCKVHNSVDPEKMRQDREQAADKIMEICDADNTGCISLEELMNVLMNRGNPNDQMTEEECQEMYSDMDRDGSGNVTREDLLEYLCDNRGNILMGGQGPEESV